ncbi:MAG: PIN domain-containing protein [Terracidiphilus sp.]|jgi:predicted nucleic acid-binding protein
MILVDTSVWIDHLRSTEPALVKLLNNDQVATHPLVRLELALGSIANREHILSELAKLFQPQAVRMDDLFLLVDARRLERRGIGVTDLHLIASALIDRSISIWTRDRHLGEILDQLGLRAPIP